MQIEKINENQLEVTLNIEDLKRKNISLHSFMCNSSESKYLFFDILNFADKKIGFSLKNYEIIIEAFSVPSNSSFILLITRVPKKFHLYPSKRTLGNLKFNQSFWVKFNTLEDFCMYCKIFKKYSSIKASLYLLDNCYFLHIKANNVKGYLYLLNESYEFSGCIYGHNFILEENAKPIIKNCAIQTAIKYFA